MGGTGLVGWQVAIAGALVMVVTVAVCSRVCPGVCYGVPESFVDADVIYLIFCLYFPSEAVCVCKQYTVNISYFKHVN